MKLYTPLHLSHLTSTCQLFIALLLIFNAISAPPPTQTTAAHSRTKACHLLLSSIPKSTKQHKYCISHGVASFSITCLRSKIEYLATNYAMEALNAASLTPISVLCERRTEPRKVSSLPTPIKLSKSASLRTSSLTIQDCLSRTLNGSLILLSYALGAGVAKALTYQEALEQSVSSPVSDFEASEVLDTLVNFVTENPAVVAGGIAVLAVPLVLSQVLKKSQPWGVESARKAYTVLGEDSSAQLLDIRPPVDIRQAGRPDISGLRKKPVSIAYKGTDKPGFLKKLSLKFKEPEKTTLFILDKFDGNSELVAELVTVNGFKAAYAIKDGAEGPRGWLKSGLPWMAPKKSLSFDLSNLTGALGDDSDAFPLTLGLAAAAGLGVLAFSEVETILQVLGSAAIIQFVSRKFLLAEDRKKTLQQIDELLNTKIAPQELVDDIKDIGKALLPTTVNSKALPSPAETSSETAAVAEPNVKAAAPQPPQVNSVPTAEGTAEPDKTGPRPLSPYPAYPDFKPPTSPSPSQP